MKKLLLICASVFTLHSTFVQSSELKTMLVTDGNMNDQASTDIYFGESDENYCTLSLNNELIGTNVITKSKSNNNNNLSIDCNWDGAYYVQSSKHLTTVTTSFPTLSTEAKTATLDFSLKLINTKDSRSYFRLDNQKLLITGEMFDSLGK